MKIVIAGAGEIGFHLAKLLSTEKQDITVIDINQEALDWAQMNLDVLTIKGDSSSLSILKRAEAGRADLFLAVTTSEENNLMSAIVAKKLGARQTIARVTNPEYIAAEQKQFFSELGIDHTISPRELAAQEIKRLLEGSDVTDAFEFEDGKVVVLGILIDERSNILNRTVGSIQDQYPDKAFSPIAILRGGKTIFPQRNTYFQRKDHVFFITDRTEKKDVTSIISEKNYEVRKVMILGGSNTAIRTAELLENDYKVAIVDPNKQRCVHMAETLQEALIIKGQPTDSHMLKEEGLAHMDAVISLTPNNETNIMSCLMADVNGVYKTIALVDNVEYTHISHNIGVDTLINKKLITANNIFRFVRKGKIEAICALHGVDAEIIEFVITKKNRITKKKLRDLHFPANAIIGAVVRDGVVHHPNGDFVLDLEDKVIVFAMNECINSVEKFFK